MAVKYTIDIIDYVTGIGNGAINTTSAQTVLIAQKVRVQLHGSAFSWTLTGK